MGKAPLTDLAIRNMKPGSELSDIGENRGLRVSKGKTGVTSFTYRYRSPGRGGADAPLRQMKIGSYPTIGLKEARIILARLKAIRANGVDPAAAHKTSELAFILRQTAVSDPALEDAIVVIQMLAADITKLEERVAALESGGQLHSEVPI